MSQPLLSATGTQTVQTAQGKRSVELDVLRCFAVLLVLFNHSTPWPEQAPGFLRVIHELLRRGGWIGVDLFFVLSGFLISGLLFREYVIYRRINFKHFFIRRGFKIYPPLYFLVLVTVVLAFLAHKPIEWWRVLCEFFFVQNYGRGVWDHTWTLAIEEHFYLTLPWLLIGLIVWQRRATDPFRALPAIFLAAAAVILGWRIYKAFHSQSTPEDIRAFTREHFFLTHMRIDSLFFGVILSYFHHFRPDGLRARVTQWRLPLIAMVLFGVAPAFLFNLVETPFLYTIGYSLLYLAFGSLLVLVVVLGLPRGRLLDPFFRFCGFVGFYSYSIYLWHLMVRDVSAIIFRRFPRFWMLELPFYIAAAVLAGIVLSRLVEIPSLRLRDRLFPSRSKALPSATDHPAPTVPPTPGV